MTTPAASLAPTAWRDRVVALERLTAAEIRPHPDNWRGHPDTQRAVLKGILDDVGVAGALLVYRSARADGAYVLIDGHLRAEDYPDQRWPCLVLDVDDAEADVLLATVDPIATLAASDRGKLGALLSAAQAGASNEALLASIRKVAEAQGVALTEGNPWGPMPLVEGEQREAVRCSLSIYITNREATGAVRDALELLVEDHPEWQASVEVIEA